MSGLPPVTACNETMRSFKECISLQNFRSVPLRKANRLITRHGSCCRATNGSNGSKPMYGPPLPRNSHKQDRPIERPEWVQDLINDAAFDEEVAQLLEGTDNEPDRIREKMRESMRLKHQQIYGTQLGSERTVKIRFREVDPSNLWLWFELYSTPSDKEIELLQTLLWSWFMVGKFGGFNGMNLQLYQKGDDDSSYFDYDHEEADESMDAFVHEMQTLETQAEWARCWVDLGTADEMALDVLINMMLNFSQQTLGIKSLYIGGENEDWEIPEDFMADQEMNPLELARSMYNRMGGVGNERPT